MLTNKHTWCFISVGLSTSYRTSWKRNKLKKKIRNFPPCYWAPLLLSLLLLNHPTCITSSISLSLPTSIYPSSLPPLSPSLSLWLPFKSSHYLFFYFPQQVSSPPETSQIICCIFSIIPLFLCDSSSESENVTLLFPSRFPRSPALCSQRSLTHLRAWTR